MVYKRLLKSNMIFTVDISWCWCPLGRLFSNERNFYIIITKVNSHFPSLEYLSRTLLYLLWNKTILLWYLQMCGLKQCISYWILGLLVWYFHVSVKMLKRLVVNKIVFWHNHFSFWLIQIITGWKDSSHCISVFGWEAGPHHEPSFCYPCSKKSYYRYRFIYEFFRQYHGCVWLFERRKYGTRHWRFGGSW